jgi:FkbM family methyltransferase
MLLFDIGANIGTWALNNYTEETKIISVEASPTTFQTLQENTSGKNIIALNFAITSSKEEFVDFFDCSANTISTLDESWLKDPRSRFFNQHAYKKISVPTLTIDKLILEHGIPDILKVDVEGAENIALRSLSTQAKIICFEWASEWNEKTFDALNHLVSLGYEKFHIQNHDNYMYRPPSYTLTKTQVVEALNLTKPKLDWGMIWATI